MGRGVGFMGWGFPFTPLSQYTSTNVADTEDNSSTLSFVVNWLTRIFGNRSHKVRLSMYQRQYI